MGREIDTDLYARRQLVVTKVITYFSCVCVPVCVRVRVFMSAARFSFSHFIHIFGQVEKKTGKKKPFKHPFHPSGSEIQNNTFDVCHLPFGMSLKGPSGNGPGC